MLLVLKNVLKISQLSLKLRLLLKNFTIIFIMTLLTGCGNKQPVDSSKILAKVNGKAVTEAQVKFERVSKPELTKQQATDLIIDRLLFVEAAKSTQLDQDLEVKMEVDRQTSALLTVNYIKKNVLPNLPQPSKQDIEIFYHRHPHLFADNKLWTVFECALDVKDINSDMKKRLMSVPTPEALIALLNQEHILFTTHVLTRSISDYPAEYSKEIVEGNKFIINKMKTLGIVFVLSSKADSISLEKATPSIKNYFKELQSEKKTHDIIKKLRSEAVLEYFNDPIPVNKPFDVLNPTKK